MNQNEIKALGRRRELERLFAGKKVWLRNPQGMYMCRPDSKLGHGVEWEWDNANAQIFDFDVDRVADQLFDIQMEQGDEWEVEQARLPYSVLLLYPDYLADTYGQDTFLATVQAIDPTQAVVLAREHMAAAQHTVPEAAEDPYLLLVCEGTIRNLSYKGELL